MLYLWKIRNAMGNKLFAAFMAVVAAVSCAGTARAGDIGGAWSGELKVNPRMSLKLVFHISAPGEKPESVAMDSPDQGAYGIGGDVLYLSADSVSVAFPKLMAGFDGSLKEGRLKGEFRQGAMRLPLDMTRGEVKADRPQTPVPPYPYSEEEVSVPSADGAVLSGTVTLPENAGSDTPMVVMVTGSGLQDRDETLFEHRPFAVIADFLARNGVGSLRYDDRGFGKSTGDPSSATTDDNAADAAAAVAFLRDRGCRKVGLLGHSEGGLVGYMLGASGKSPDFIIGIGSPAVRGDSIIHYQNMKAMKSASLSAAMLDECSAALREILRFKVENPGSPVSGEVMEAACPGWSEKPVYRELAVEMQKGFSKPNPWLDRFIAYSPATDMRSVGVPMLLIYGEKDTQVPPVLNEKAARANAPAAEVMVFPGLNHMMQHATTGEVSEYATIEETISPEVLDTILRFIVAR